MTLARREIGPASAKRTTRSDAEVVRDAQAGDRHAMGMLYDRHAAYVQRVIRRVLGADTETADLLQDTFVAAFGRLERLREPEKFRAWVAQIAVNLVRTRLRARRARAWLTFGSELPEVEVAGLDAAARETLRRAYAILAKLPVEERLVFSLCHLEGMSLDELASACGTSVATAKRRLRRARERVSKLASLDPALRTLVTSEDDHEP
ncbi:MAG: sigma-70 family RNA polymerase sigma factor [Sandaracinus sp.]|nr:sigma-70 family RNA polymerase sigma factor [Sandaracinus sp.]